MSLPEKKNSSLLSRDFLLIGLIVTLINYVSMPAEMVPGDSGAARCEAISLLNTGSLAVPERIADVPGVQPGQYFFKNETTGLYYSKYGILNTLVYIPPLFAEKLYAGNLTFGSSSSRVLFLNWFNIICALITAAYLYKFASLYTSSLLIKALYILTTFYCTFWWDHLRIQAFEAYQPLLLIGACYHFISACNAVADPAGEAKAPKGHLLGAGLLLGLLWLSKASYILIAPLFVALLVTFEWKNIRRDRVRLLWSMRTYGIYFGLPMLACFAALLATNAFKFGSPFNNGYNQWTREQHMWTGNILYGVAGFLFEPQFSIFITFPVLIIALFGLPGFIRGHRKDALVIYSVAILLLLVNSKFLNWRGLWSYGPRYMLPVLAMMSLPFVPVIEGIIRNIKKKWSMGAALAIVLTLGYSAHLQMNVNAVAFYAVFYLKEKLSDKVADPPLNNYFARRHFGLICGDLIAYKNGKPLWFRDRVEMLVNDRDVSAHIDSYIAKCSHTNYYLFQDEH